MIRNILSVIAGIAIATTIFTISESILVHKSPIHIFVDKNDSQMMESFMAMLTTKALLLVLLGYIIGSLAAGFVISIISKSSNKKLPIVAGIILTVASMINIRLVAHPTWFIVAGCIVFIPSVLLGSYLFNFKFNN